MSISLLQLRTGLPAMGGSVAAGTPADLSHHAQPVAGPYIGWDPVQFDHVGGFAGGIRSVSGVFRQAAVAVKGRILADASSHGDFWGLVSSMREAARGDADAFSVLEHFAARFVDRYHDDRTVLYQLHRWCEFLNELYVDHEQIADLLEIEDAVRLVTQGDLSPLAAYRERALAGDMTAALKLGSIRNVSSNRFGFFGDECVSGARERFEQWDDDVYQPKIREITREVESDRSMGEPTEFVIELFGVFGGLVHRDERVISMLNILACEYDSCDAQLKIEDLSEAGHFQSNGHTPLGVAHAYSTKRRPVPAPGETVVNMPQLLRAVTSKGG